MAETLRNADTDFSPPQQQRSCDTLDRIEKATRSLLSEKTFEAVTMDEIAQRAGISVGNLYNRFRNKDALLNHTLDQLQLEQFDLAEVLFAPEKWQGLCLAERLSHLVSGIKASTDSSDGLLRAVLVREILHPDSLGKEQIARSKALMEMFGRWLTDAPDAIPHDDPALASQMTVAMISILIQHTALIRTTESHFTTEVYLREVTRAMAAYLGAGEQPIEPKKKTIAERNVK